MFAFCRSKPIRSTQYLGHQSRHARREDETSKPRVRGDDVRGLALSWSIDDGPRPDYAASFRSLKKARGAGERKGAQLGLHMLVGVSPEWVREAGDLHDPENPRNRQLLAAAKAWADTWSGGGCYAARLDLDETGGAVVDLFIAPLAEQRHKSGKAKLVVSVNKALEAVSVARTGKKSKHYAALNTDWAEYAQRSLDRRLERGRPKGETGVEHVGPDQYRVMMQEAEAARDVAREAERRATAAEMRAVDALDGMLRGEQAKMDEVARIAALAGAAVVVGELSRANGRQWSLGRLRPEREMLRRFWSSIRPALEAVEGWLTELRAKPETEPDPASAAPAAEDPSEDTGPGPSF
ncbi:MAG: hypothetical protein Q4P24_16535 [Rhodobacterales bacterium]|nr:hypothetical protein [Rhodobacterales bacterium]